MQLEFYSLSTILLSDFNLIFLIVSLISSVGVISDFCFLIHGFSSNEFVLQSFLANVFIVILVCCILDFCVLVLVPVLHIEHSKHFLLQMSSVSHMHIHTMFSSNICKHSFFNVCVCVCILPKNTLMLEWRNLGSIH